MGGGSTGLRSKVMIYLISRVAGAEFADYYTFFFCPSDLCPLGPLPDCQGVGIARGQHRQSKSWGMTGVKSRFADAAVPRKPFLVGNRIRGNLDIHRGWNEPNFTQVSVGSTITEGIPVVKQTTAQGYRVCPLITKQLLEGSP